MAVAAIVIALLAICVNAYTVSWLVRIRCYQRQIDRYLNN